MNHLIIDFSVCARVVAMWVDSFLCMHLSVSVCVCVSCQNKQQWEVPVSEKWAPPLFALLLLI